MVWLQSYIYECVSITKLSGANLHDHYNLMPTVIKSRCMKDTVVNKMSECVSVLQCIKLYILVLNHFRLLTFNIGSCVAQYNDQMVL